MSYQYTIFVLRLQCRKAVMYKISIRNFIKELDSFFAKEDLQGAEQCALKWLELAREHGDKPAELTIYNEMTGFYRQTGNAEKGLEAVSKAFSLLDEFDSDWRTRGVIYLNGATTMKAFGKSAEAMEYYEKAENYFKDMLDKNDPLWAGFYNNKALALQDLKRYDEAEEYFLKAIEFTENSEKNELETAISLVNLAHLYYEINSEGERINPLMDRALDILDCPDYFGYMKYAFTCRKCAPSFGFFGFFLAEKRLNERADRIYAGN